MAWTELWQTSRQSRKAMNTWHSREYHMPGSHNSRVFFAQYIKIHTVLDEVVCIYDMFFWEQQIQNLKYFKFKLKLVLWCLVKVARSKTLYWMFWIQWCWLDKICQHFTSVLLRFGFMLLPELFYSLTRNVFFVHNIIFTTSEYKCVSGS